ncbi:unnamed protein product, partial [Cylicostephanus goldi]
LAVSLICFVNFIAAVIIRNALLFLFHSLLISSLYREDSSYTLPHTVDLFFVLYSEMQGSQKVSEAILSRKPSNASLCHNFINHSIIVSKKGSQTIYYCALRMRSSRRSPLQPQLASLSWVSSDSSSSSSISQSITSLSERRCRCYT